jgi:hypothetical protein
LTLGWIVKPDEAADDVAAYFWWWDLLLAMLAFPRAWSDLADDDLSFEDADDDDVDVDDVLGSDFDELLDDLCWWLVIGGRPNAAYGSVPAPAPKPGKFRPDACSRAR